MGVALDAYDCAHNDTALRVCHTSLNACRCTIEAYMHVRVLCRLSRAADATWSLVRRLQCLASLQRLRAGRPRARHRRRVGAAGAPRAAPSGLDDDDEMPFKQGARSKSYNCTRRSDDDEMPFKQGARSSKS